MAIKGLGRGGMQSTKRDTLCALLDAMSAKGVTLTKIAIQKAAYFLSYQGVTVGFKFKPFTYGPYSVDLSQELDDLVFWDHLSVVDKKTYSIDKLPDYDKSKLEKVTEHVDCFFEKILETKNPTFKDVEIYGTILHCQRALNMLDVEITAESVLEEFKGWKGDRYPDKEIADAYNHLARVLN